MKMSDTLYSQMAVQTEENEKLAQRVVLLERQLKLHGEQYEALLSRIEETKRARHDLRHHMTVIKSYIEAGEKEALNAYLREYERSWPEEADSFFCANHAVNSILQYYAVIAKSEGVAVDVRLDLPKDLDIGNTDLCIVFGNCVENAVEACRRGGADKFVRIRSKVVGETLVVTIDNSFDGIVKMDGDMFLSRKCAGGGVGLSSVTAVARKYGGAARFEAKDGVFQAVIMLPLP